MSCSRFFSVIDLEFHNVNATMREFEEEQEASSNKTSREMGPAALLTIEAVKGQALAQKIERYSGIVPRNWVRFADQERSLIQVHSEWRLKASAAGYFRLAAQLA